MSKHHLSETTQPDSGLSPLKRALVAIQDLTTRLEAAQRARHEPIAIVGMACRFPGGADDPQRFWELLRDGRNSVREVPPDRWDVDAYYDPDPDAAGKMYSRTAGFLDQPIDRFDARFFEIAPREALAMDPQQRLLLELAWESLEDAGCPPQALVGSKSGVFVGISTADYATRGSRLGGSGQIDAYSGTGNAFSVAAGRISYLLGLQGPNLALDTACSSSLVAVALAVQSLRDGHSDLALAGGVNLILSPETSIGMCKLRALAPDGRCKTFAAGANGYVRGEGGGVVVLKRLSDALAAADRIQALIRGAAVNHDGRSSGLTVPNAAAQQAVIRAALQDAGLPPEAIDYVEAHGTGTELGDPIEIRSLNAALGRDRKLADPLTVGSVKTNFGHLEAAAGMAGLIKLVLSLRHEAIPPHLHFEQPTPHLDWEELPLVIPTVLTPWQRGERPRVAGVSSFGFSGTNAHVLVEEAPSPEPTPAAVERPVHLLPLSAKTPEALRELAGRYLVHLEHTADPLADVCFTAGAGRNHFEHRLALVGRTAEEMRAGIDSYLRGENAPQVRAGAASSLKPPKIAFLFTGQGSQYVRMGRELYETQPTFRQALNECNEISRATLERPLLSVLFPADEAAAALLDQTAFTQPALFALEVGLARLWRAWGIEPAMVMGHSVGEYAAACVAGVFSLEDGLKLVAERARLMQALPEAGAMAAVFADEQQVRRALAGYEELLAVAALNGLEHTVISGAAAALDEVLRRLRREGIHHRRLAVSHAFHSPLMEPLCGRLAQLAGELRFSEPSIPLVSNLTGALAQRGDLTQSSYWSRHIREPVRFAEGITALAAQGCTAFLEIGPATTLLDLGRRCLPEQNVAWLPSLRQGRAEWQQILESLATLYAAGAKPDWAATARDYARTKVTLPSYPFQREGYWIEGSEARPGKVRHSAAALDGGENGRHPLLARRLCSPALRDHVFESELDLDAFPLLQDHQIYDTAVFPASGYVEAALAAAHEALGWTGCELVDFVIREPLLVARGAARTVQVILSERSSGAHEFRFVSAAAREEAGAWTVHAAGELWQKDAEESNVAALDEARLRCTEPVLTPALYDTFTAVGIRYGDSFRGIEAAWRGQGEAIGRLRISSHGDTQAGTYRLHPGLLDSCLQLIAAALPPGHSGEDAAIYLPTGFDRLRFSGATALDGWGEVTLHPESAGTAALGAELRLCGEDGRFVVEIQGLRIVRVARETFLRQARSALDDWLYRLAWRPLPRPLATESTSREEGSWLIFADEGGVGKKLAAHLTEAGDKTVLISRAEAFASIAEGHFAVRPEWKEDLERVLAEVVESGTRCVGIVHLWALDEAPGAPAGLNGIETTQQMLCGSVLHLVQAFERLGGAAPPALWLVTRGAQNVVGDPGPLALASAGLWGLGRTIALEYPRLRCVLLDLDADIEPRVEEMAQELRATEVRENQIALRSSGRFVLRLTQRRGRSGREAGDAAPLSALRADATYLITGGLGGLGLAVARWMAERGARRLVLLGRREPAAAADEAISRMQALGTEVVPVQADVARRDELARALAAVEVEDRPLRGVIHAAGLLDDAMLAQLEWERFARVAAPKVAGAWNLHTLTQDRPLDFFLLFSSTASVLGSAGQGNYAAANAFLDALAHHRRALGLPALSINWGAWSEIGMAAEREAHRGRRTAFQGIDTIAPEEGCRVLATVRPMGDTQLCVLPADWVVVSAALPPGDEPPILAELILEARTRAVRADAPAAESLIRSRLEAGSEAEQRVLLEDHLRHRIARVLGIATSELDEERSFSAWGLDSLMAVEFRNHIERDLQISLPPALLLGTPSIAALAQEILETMKSAPAGVNGTPPSPHPLAPRVGSSENDGVGLLHEIDELSDERVDALLAELLEENS